jgi:hypothetical protein
MTNLRSIRNELKVLKEEIAPPSRGRLSLTVHVPRDLSTARVEETLASLIGPDWRQHDVVVFKTLLVNEGSEIVEPSLLRSGGTVGHIRRDRGGACAVL